MTDSVPPIPLWLNKLPTVGGLVVPAIAAQDSAGRVFFGTAEEGRLRHALRHRLCGVCFRALEDRMVLLLRASDLAVKASFEPALHPQCSHYTAKACPVVSGRKLRYRSTPAPITDEMLRVSDEPARLGAVVGPWFAAWVPRYAITEINGRPAASYEDIASVRIKPVGGDWIAAALAFLAAQAPEG